MMPSNIWNFGIPNPRGGSYCRMWGRKEWLASRLTFVGRGCSQTLIAFIPTGLLCSGRSPEVDESNTTSCSSLRRAEILLRIKAFLEYCSFMMSRRSSCAWCYIEGLMIVFLLLTISFSHFRVVLVSARLSIRLIKSFCCSLICCSNEASEPWSSSSSRSYGGIPFLDISKVNERW